ncbi:hypothetical protein [uncultured Methanobrevibacter sp.]|uniref:hypothetical protein n=1 Tax=uncultured Methanobrevibacter sp. TaxID=253161 RepID=UPI0025EC85AC|nr:hypothetical protein [uncultured Methanobrevibacter sp.]
MIKIFEEFINEAATFTDEQFQTVVDHIGELEKEFEKELKFKVKLNVEKEPRKIVISSDDILHNSKDPILNAIFKEMTIDFWGGNYNENENCFWFNPKIMYKHYGGGSNGTQFLWNNIWFLLDTKTWKFDKIK